jgi:two-component system, NarL family, invasion response regulator UvrY
MVRVLIADDHPIVRGGLKELLVRQLETVVCGEASNADEALAQVHRQPWDVLILDITMPGRSGFDILSDVRQVQPRLPILVLSVHPEDQYAKRAIKAGASGYLQKESAPEELIEAVRKLLAGRRYVSASLAERFAEDLHEGADRPAHDALSAREFEVLVMIGSGKTVTQIAEELHLSAATVSTYRTRVLEKMNMATTAELMRYAFRNHLVD